MRWVVGNWKMHTTPSEAAALARQLREVLAPLVVAHPEVRVVVCPPFTSLEAVRHVLLGSPIAWGAQNCHEEVQGAYTGEVSARMLHELGCTVVLVGHSERRRYAGEDDGRIARKLRRVLEFGMMPVLCVGETLAERRAGYTEAVLERQLRCSLAGLPEGAWNRLLIAYEPVWAIGTGVAAEPEQIAGAHAFVSGVLRDLGAPAAVPILYGGSVNAENVRRILAQPTVWGVLVGTASLDVAQFCDIVRAAWEVPCC